MLSDMRYSVLRFYHFVDAEDQELGTLEDVVIDAQSLRPVAILLGGGFFEEFMESRGDLDDIDELAPISSIEKIEDDFVILGNNLEDMQTTSKDGALPVDGYKFTDLMNRPVYDQNREIEGKLYDLEFNENKSRFFIHFPTLMYQMTTEGYSQRFDVSVPLELVSIDSEYIIVKITKDKIIAQIQSQIQKKSRGRSLLVID